MKNEKTTIVIAGCIIGVISSLLVLFGNPSNMGFCIACFLRDTSGALGLHSAAAVQYVRPEIIGLVLGAFIMALCKKEFRGKGGSSPMTRFVLGFFVMIGCLMFLGCPFRMILRLAGGDLNALFGLAGFVVGILAGVYFLNRGYSLKRTYSLSRVEGAVLPIIQIVLLMGFVAIFASALVCNLILNGVTEGTYFHLAMADQPIAHTDGLWNFLGMVLTGFGCVLLGGCPLRQLVLSGEGNSDSAVTVIGLIVGAAFAHNFGLASSANGPTANGKIAVIVGLVVVAVIACLNTFGKKKACE